MSTANTSTPAPVRQPVLSPNTRPVPGARHGEVRRLGEVLRSQIWGLALSVLAFCFLELGSRDASVGFGIAGFLV
jgi:hypothetical protein